MSGRTGWTFTSPVLSLVFVPNCSHPSSETNPNPLRPSPWCRRLQVRISCQISSALSARLHMQMLITAGACWGQSAGGWNSLCVSPHHRYQHHRLPFPQLLDNKDNHLRFPSWLIFFGSASERLERRRLIFHAERLSAQHGPKVFFFNYYYFTGGVRRARRRRTCRSRRGGLAGRGLG